MTGESHGFCSKIRYLSDDTKAHESHLAAAPLGPRQRKWLAEKIIHQKAELKETRKKYREWKKQNT